MSQWIPVTERLPVDGETVLVWYEYFRYGSHNRFVKAYGLAWHYHGEWGGDMCGRNARCIAWTHIPEPPTAEELSYDY